METMANTPELQQAVRTPQQAELEYLGMLRAVYYFVYSRTYGMIQGGWEPAASGELMNHDTVPHVERRDGELMIPMCRLTKVSGGHDHALKFVSIRDLRRLNPDAGIPDNIEERFMALQAKQMPCSNSEDLTSASNLQEGRALMQAQAVQTLDTSIQALAIVSDQRKEQEQRGECMVFVNDE